MNTFVTAVLPVVRKESGSEFHRFQEGVTVTWERCVVCVAVHGLCLVSCALWCVVSRFFFMLVVFLFDRIFAVVHPVSSSHELCLHLRRRANSQMDLRTFEAPPFCVLQMFSADGTSPL